MVIITKSIPNPHRLGERSHLATAEVNLDTHIQDVENVFKDEELEDVILAGHSSSGLVATGVANRIPEQVAHLVYLDAIVPRAGQALLDDWSAEGRIAVEEEARLGGEGWRWPMITMPKKLDHILLEIAESL